MNWKDACKDLTVAVTGSDKDVIEKNRGTDGLAENICAEYFDLKRKELRRLALAKVMAMLDRKG